MKQRKAFFVVLAACAAMGLVFVGCASTPQIDEQGSQAALKAGNDLYNQDKYDEAIAQFTKAIQMNPNNAEAYQKRAWAYSDKQEPDFNAALADSNKFVELAPNDNNAYFFRGEMYLNLKNNDAAIADFDKAIELNPKGATAHFWRGTAYVRKSDMDKAIADWEQAVKLDPNYADAYHNLGVAYERQDKKDKAVKNYILAGKNYEFRSQAAVDDYRFALKLASDNVEALVELGAQFDGAGGNDVTLDEAQKSLNHAIELDPKNAMAYNWRAAIEYDSMYNAEMMVISAETWDNVIADESKAIELDPKNATWYGNRGFYYYTQARKWLITPPDQSQQSQYYANAVADYSKAIELDASNASCFDGRADVYLAQKNYDKAIADYQQAVKLAPKNETYQNDLKKAQDAKAGKTE
jgi:tetratricopeptide (TPR) repeat protein